MVVANIPTEVHGEAAVAAHFVTRWLPQTQAWVFSQIAHLPATEFRVVVLCNSQMKDSSYSWRPVFPLRQINDPSYLLAGLVRRTLNSRFHPHLVRAIRHAGARILHTHFGDSAWRNALAAQAARVPHVASFYGYDATMLPKTRPMWRDRYRDLFGRIDRILCEGPAFAATIAELGCPPEKITVHPLGIDLESLPFSPRGWDGTKAIRFILAGRFVEKKGFRYAIEAIGRISRRAEVEVTLVGGPDDTEESRRELADMHTAIEHCGLQSKTRWLGFLPLVQLRAEIAGHHFFMAPSVTAANGDSEGGVPVTVIEAQALGVAVIASRHCDIPFVLRQGVPLAEERDVDGLVRQIEIWLNSPSSLAANLRAGREHAERGFDAVKQGRRLADIYRQTILLHHG